MEKQLRSLGWMALLFPLLSFGQAPLTQLTNNDLRVNLAEGGGILGDNRPGIELATENGLRSLVFNMGLVLGGIEETGELQVWDFSRGGSPGLVDQNASLGSFWRVTAQDVADHQADFADNGVIDNPNPAVYAWPGRGNPFFTDYNAAGLSLPNTPLAVAPFWDEDADGVYDPNQGDYPVAEIRGCDGASIVPTEMIWVPFHATAPDGSLDSIQVYMTALKIGCEEEENTLNQSVFLHYKLINSRSMPLDSTYIGYYMDGDIGCPTDDYLGVFSDRLATYFYNENPNDGGDTCFLGESYGLSAPTVGVDVLRGPLNDELEAAGALSIMPIYNAAAGSFPPGATDFNTMAEAYRYLTGRWRDGSPLVDSGIGYGDGEETNYAFPGDPQSGTGWSELSENNPAGDRRALISYGPKTLQPGMIDEFIVGLTYQYDPSQEPLEQIMALRDRVDEVQATFDSCLSPGAGCTQVLTRWEEGPAQLAVLEVYPNPAENHLTLSFGELTAGQLQIYTALGQLKEQHPVRSNRMDLDVSAWSKGLYFLRWEVDGHQVTKKLFVQ